MAPADSWPPKRRSSLLVSRPEFSKPRMGRKGYNHDEVDSFVDLIIAKLKGKPEGDGVTAADLGVMVFHEERGASAYDSDEVDEWITRVRPKVKAVEGRRREEDLPADRPGSVIDMAAPPHYADRFPRVSRAVLGFAIDDVDDAMDLLRAQLSGADAPTSKQIMDLSFREQSGGYRQVAVAQTLELIALARDAGIASVAASS